LHDERASGNEMREKLGRHVIADAPVFRDVDEENLDWRAVPLLRADVAVVHFDQIRVRRDVRVELFAKTRSGRRLGGKENAACPPLDFEATARMNEFSRRPVRIASQT